MAVNFPDNPSNGDTTEVNGVTYTYNATKNLWKAGSSSSGGVAELGTLTKTFVLNEESTITLSDSVSPVPNVSVFKEIPQEGFSTKGNWDVAADASNYEILNEAINLYSGVDITPSSATANGTFSLDNSGTPVYISNSDVGKRVVGNGGEAIITAADGSYELVTNFNDTNTITAGNWSLQAATGKSDGSGITLSQFATNDFSLTNKEPDQWVNYGTDFSQPRGITWKPDGTVLYVCDYTENRIKMLECSTPFDISTGVYNPSSPLGTVTLTTNIDSWLTNPIDIQFKPDGTKAFIAFNGANSVVELQLNTPWYFGSIQKLDELVVNSVEPDIVALALPPDGSSLIIFGYDKVVKYYDLSSGAGWDLSAASYDSSRSTFNVGAAIPGQLEGTLGFGMDWRSDGTRFMLMDINGRVNEYECTTPWDPSTASYTGYGFASTVNGRLSSPSGVTYTPDNDKIIVSSYGGTKEFGEWDISVSAAPISQYFPAVTGTGGQIDTTGWSDINTMTADETLNGGEIYYAVSTDNRTTWKVNLNGSGERSIVRNNSGTWEYNSETGSVVNTFDVQNLSYVGNVATSPLIANAPNPPAQSYTLADFIVSPDGTKIIIVSAQRMHELTMSTPYDITTAIWTDKYDYDAYNPSTWGGYGFLEAGESGSRIYMADWANHKIDQFTLSVPYSFSGTVSWAGEVSNINGSGASRSTNGMYVKDSTTVFILKDDSIGNNAIIEEWTMSTPWDITTLSYNNVTFTISGQRGTDIEFSDDGTKLFIVDQFGSSTMRMFEIGTPWDITTINTSTNVVTWTTSPNPNGTSGIINFSKSGEKMYLGESTTIYEYDTSSAGTPAYNTTESWSAASTNNELAALQQALGVTINRMDSTQLNAISDANHFALGDTLDLMIAPYSSSETNIPISDGVTINYDADALVEQAINGTDYKVQFPANDTVKIISLADQTLKIRIL